MTYNQLKAHIETMDAEQLNQDVTIFNAYKDEYEPITDIDYTSAGRTDVLDPLHPFLIIQG